MIHGYLCRRTAVEAWSPIERAHLIGGDYELTGLTLTCAALLFVVAVLLAVVHLPELVGFSGAFSVLGKPLFTEFSRTLFASRG